MKIFVLLLVFCPVVALAQPSTLRGRVTNPNGKPAEFVNIVLKDTQQGAITDAEGRYAIAAVKPGKYTLQASFVGIDTQQQTVAVGRGQELTVDLVLQETSAQLQEVVVTGQGTNKYVETIPSASLRLNAPLIEIPQNIAVVTKRMMQDFGVLGTADMARMTSGIIRRWGSNNDFSFTIRGTDAGNNVFRNGVGGYWWNQQADAFMMDRVEFVKGPAGFMIGNSEPGGLLNEVTKQADGLTVHEVDLGYGSWNLLRAGVDVGGKFSPTSRFSYRLVVGGQRTAANYDFYKSSRVYLTPSLRYTYRAGSFVQLEMISMHGTSIAENYSNVSFTGEDRLFPLTFNPIDPSALKGYKNGDNYFRLSHAQQLGKGWQLKSQLAHIQGYYYGDGMYVAKMSPKYDTLYREYYYWSYSPRLRAAQSFVDGKFRTGSRVEHAVLAGLDYGRVDIRGDWADLAGVDSLWGKRLPLVVSNPQYNMTREAIADTTGYPGYSYGTEWGALYVQDHMKLFGKVVVTLAGRLSRTRTYASWDSTTVYNTKFTPRFGLTYLVNNHMSVYSLYDETFLPQTGQKEDRTNPKPLTGSNMELGYKSQWFGQRLAFNASLFRTVKNNVLVQKPGTDFYIERGQITSQGLETDLVGNLTPNLTANINYTYTDARITKDDQNPESVGFPNYGVAKHTGNAMLRYKFLAGKLQGLSFGAGVQLMGRRPAVWAGWTDPKDMDKTSPAYTLWDANIAYETDRFSIRLNGFNLSNHQTMDGAWWNSVTEDNPVGYFSYTPLQPINFRMAVNYRF